MLDPRLAAEGRPTRSRRLAFAVVDGSDHGWRALAWTIGYAGALDGTAVHVVAHVRALPWFLGAEEASGILLTQSVTGDPEAPKSLLRAARSACLEAGVATTGSCTTGGSTRQLIRLAGERRPDIVVLGSMGVFTGLATRRISAALSRRGIPVMIVP